MDHDDRDREPAHSSDPAELRQVIRQQQDALREAEFEREKWEWERSEIAKALKAVAAHTESTSEAQAKILRLLDGLMEHRAILASLPSEMPGTSPASSAK